jgi:hypothetical protein
MTGAPFGLAGGKPHRNSANSLVPSSRRRITGARSVGQMSSRGSMFGGALGNLTDARIWLKALRYSSYGTRLPKSLHLLDQHPDGSERTSGAANGWAGLHRLQLQDGASDPKPYLPPLHVAAIEHEIEQACGTRRRRRARGVRSGDRLLGRVSRSEIPRVYGFTVFSSQAIKNWALVLLAFASTSTEVLSNLTNSII